MMSNPKPRTTTLPNEVTKVGIRSLNRGWADYSGSWGLVIGGWAGFSLSDRVDNKSACKSRLKAGVAGENESNI